MKQNTIYGRLRVALGLALAVGASAAASSPLHAQASSRFRVLVPALQGTKAGAKVAELVRKNIDQMNTHVSIPEKELKTAIKKLGAKESEMGCLQYRQLMQHVDAKLVMCGTVDANGQVTAQFFNPDGSSYDVPAFALSSEAQAAEQITKGFGEYIQMLNVLVYCDDYLNSSQWEDALNNCSKAAELNPKSAHALYGRASALRAMDKHEEALAGFQKVLEIDPINQDAMMSAAIEASTLNQEELSSKYWNEYLELNPGNAQVRLSLATRVAKEGDFRGALKLLEGVEGADTADVVVREYSGHFAMSAAGKLVNAASGEVPTAAKDLFQKAINHYNYVVGVKGDTVNAIVLRNLMAAHGALDHSEEALAWGKKAVAHKDADAQTWSAYADQLRMANRPQEALAALDKVTQLDPKYAVAARRAVIFLDLGRLNETVAAVRQARANDELPPDQQDNIAQRLIKAGYDNFQKAKKYDQAFVYYNAARDIATKELTRGMANYLQGFGIYEQARTIQEKGTVATAKQSLPMFERAKSLLEASTAYPADNRGGLINAINQLIEIQQAIIKRG